MLNNGLGKIKINGLWVKPQSLNITLDSLADENSGRTQDGVMRINWIYNRIRKLEITLPPMLGPEISQVLDKVQGQVYDIQYFDPYDCEWQTRRFYTSNSNTSMYSGVYAGGLWQEASFNAIEMSGENTAPTNKNIIALNTYAVVQMAGDDLYITTYDNSVFELAGNELIVEPEKGTYYIEGEDLIYEE